MAMLSAPPLPAPPCYLCDDEADCTCCMCVVVSRTDTYAAEPSKTCFRTYGYVPVRHVSRRISTGSYVEDFSSFSSDFRRSSL